MTLMNNLAPSDPRRPSRLLNELYMQSLAGYRRVRRPKGLAQSGLPRAMPRCGSTPLQGEQERLGRQAARDLLPLGPRTSRRGTGRSRAAGAGSGARCGSDRTAAGRQERNARRPHPPTRTAPRVHLPAAAQPPDCLLVVGTLEVLVKHLAKYGLLGIGPTEERHG
jgi:hypothetical protein